MTDIFQILTRFRSGKWAIQGDIKKMFWQIKLTESDERFHGVIYNGETYVFTRVCFGSKPSPIIADESMMRISEWGRSNFPKGAKVIADNRYGDDILVADADVAEMIQARNETTKLLGTFGFDIKQWNSNHSDMGTGKGDGNVLGLNWDANYDTLKTQVKERREVTEFTKRVVLSHIAEIWDPIGLLAGTLVVGRIIFQSIVRMKVDWGEKIEDDELLQKWNNWLPELRKCGNVVLSRAIFHDDVFPNGAKSELIGFSDGSSVAHGCSKVVR